MQQYLYLIKSSVLFPPLWNGGRGPNRDNINQNTDPTGHETTRHGQEDQQNHRFIQGASTGKFLYFHPLKCQQVQQTNWSPPVVSNWTVVLGQRRLNTQVAISSNRSHLCGTFTLSAHLQNEGLQLKSKNTKWTESWQKSEFCEFTFHWFWEIHFNLMR